MKIVGFLSTDLMFQARISSAVQHIQTLSGDQLTSAKLVVDRTTEGLVAKYKAAIEKGDAPKLTVVDLSLPNLDVESTQASLKQFGIVVGYGPHVDHDLLQRAVECGFDQVSTRGQFDNQVASIIEYHLVPKF